MKPKSKILSLLLAICLVVGLMPTAAFAAGADTGKAIQLVDSGTAANISGGQADNIYFGTYKQSSDGNNRYNVDPIKWRVLSNADGKLFLLSDQNLDVFQYDVGLEGVTWETSTMRSWLNGYGASSNTGGTNGIDYSRDNFIDTAFSAKEQGVIADTTVVNKDNPDHGTDGGNDTTDKIFLLSIGEARSSNYFANDNSRKGTNTAYVAGGGKINSHISAGVGETNSWWLRSPGYFDGYAALVDIRGVVTARGTDVYDDYFTVRPAFNLDLTSVLFTSAAVGGKSATGMDSALTAIPAYAGNEWKLTLLDNSRNFTVSETTASGKPGDTLTLNYIGATTGTNEYISVIIEQSGETLYYGRVSLPDAENGTVNVTIPAGLTNGTYTLNVFSEQYNGDYKTDYASNFAPVNLTVTGGDTTAPTLTAGSATRDSETAATVKFTSNEAGEYYYAVVDSGAAVPHITTTWKGTPCNTSEQTIPLTSLSGAGAKDIYIVVKDAAGNVSHKLKIEIPAYGAPSYGISASPATLTNTGNQAVTVTLPSSTNYTITAGEGFTGNSAALTANDGTATFTVQPITGLGVKDYAETLTISDSNGASAQVALSFSVVEATPDTTYTLTVDLNGGSGSTTDYYRLIFETNGGSGSTTDYYRLIFETNGGSEIASIRRAEYMTIDLTDYTPTREGYEFTGWYADEDLTEEITSIRLTRNTTVYAGWEEIKENPGTGRL